MNRGPFQKVRTFSYNSWIGIRVIIVTMVITVMLVITVITVIAVRNI